MIRIPTGFGKTAGAVLTWLHHRVVRGDREWPVRLAFTLPMRTLVEQTRSEVETWLARLGLTNDVDVHVLMGGVEAGAYHLSPERPAVLIGTHDMLVSRALNRGFGARRARWPIDFGLLHHDTLWVFDEIQLMDVALATSTQLAGFRDRLAAKSLRPTRSWWMSATLQPGWLSTVDWREQLATLVSAAVRIYPEQRVGGLWAVQKTFERRPDATDPKEIAALAIEAVKGGAEQLILCVVNTVGRAVEVKQALDKALTEKTKRGTAARRVADAPEVVLVHSRYRGAEREAWPERFLNRKAPVPADGRIIVATQVVEAGLDLSANVLISDLAPWSSLIQRFGRAARYEGQTARVVVVGAPPADAKKAQPYALESLQAASQALDALVAFSGQPNADASENTPTPHVGPAILEAFEEHLASAAPALLEALYRYCPDHVIRQRDLDDLFDTTTDLSGADIDISRWVRTGDDRDVSLFWRQVEPLPELAMQVVGRVVRRELCPAPIGAVRAWIDELRSNEPRRSVYVLDYLKDAWVRLDRSDRLYPGMTLLVPADAGGYADNGFDPSSRVPVDPILRGVPALAERANARLDEASGAVDNEDLSIAKWQTIAVHGREVGAEVVGIARAIGLPDHLVRTLELAGRWHDLGKAHEAFQSRMKDVAREAVGGLALGRNLAKAPDEAWKRGRAIARPGFRHELASLLALFEIVRRADPWHPWLLGEQRELFEALGQTPDLADESLRVEVDHPLVRELLALDRDSLDLVAYLVLSHHGKLRTSIAASPLDQDWTPGRGLHGGTVPDVIAGVIDGEELPATTLCDALGVEVSMPALSLSLDLARLGLGQRFGASWSERTSRLITRHGPFGLAYLEALLRAADVRASMRVDSGPQPTTGGGAQ